MTCIEILTNELESDFTDLFCTLDQQLVDYTCTNNKIVVNTDVEFGIHLLRIKLVNNSRRLAITDVKINGASLRMMLYLSFIETAENIKLNPATTLWDQTQTWVLPFGNPVSYWFGLVYQKINNSNFGSNLYDKFHIYYPESITIPDEYPSIIKTFFQHDFDFVCVPKDTEKQYLPYAPCDISIDPVLIKAAAKEVEEKRSFILENQQPILQSAYNITENWDEEKNWRQIYLLESDPKFDRTVFPRLWALIDSINLPGKYRTLLGILPAGGAIAPHCDRANDKQVDYGYLYIPLNWPDGNYFKINGAGILSTSTAHYINIWDYTHALINNSNQDRSIIGIRYKPN